MEQQIADFIKNNSWFDIEEAEDGFVVAATRDNGNVGDETVGSEDIAKAHELKKLIEDKFNVTCEVEEVDEWTHLNVEL